MAHTTKESAIYTEPPGADGSIAPPPTTRALLPVEIVPAPPLKPKTFERTFAYGLAIGALLVGVGVGIGIGALLFAK